MAPQKGKKSNEKSDCISAVTCQNHYYEKPESKDNFLKFKKELDVICTEAPLTLNRINKEFKEITIITFRKHQGFKAKEDKLILAVEKKPCKKYNKQFQNEDDAKKTKKETAYDYFIETGLYAGEIVYGGVRFSITPDCNQLLYKTMLRRANHIYIDKKESGAAIDQDNNFLLIQYLFLSLLQKISVMGLPQEYSVQRYHDLKVHGGLDVKNYVIKDIPFKGKIYSKKNERKYVQSIVDVLYTALALCQKEVEKNFSRLSLLKQELKVNFSGRRPTFQTIQFAKKHRVLNNPMFSEYQRALEYAEIIIQNGSLLPDESNKGKAFGYLLDVASLWEVYLEYLMQQSLSNWRIEAQEELNLYQDCFFARQNYPDFVLRKKGEENKVAILDAKFKRMGFVNGDVDRADLHQIHSYAGYYREKGDTVVLCSLIYPLSKKISKKDLSKNWGGLYGIQKPDEAKTKFVIDGVYKGKKIVEKENQNEDSIKTSTDEDEESNSYKNEEVDVKNYDVAAAETAFINRIKKLLGEPVEESKMFD